MHVEIDEPGRKVLLMGNEAIARGAIEAGVDFCSGYPGNPASEILETLAGVAKKLDFLTEWSVNEIVALEAAGAAACAGLRAMTVMKNMGVDVCSDFLMTVNMSGTKGGFVLISGDDPAVHSSNSELDTRNYARFADIPLLEPATTQEAKDMTKWAFDLSEELGVLCMVRTVTRLSHSSGLVSLGPITREERSAEFAPLLGTWTSGSGDYTCMFHDALHGKLKTAQEKFEESQFNWYTGKEDAEFIIITSGTGWLYSAEAVKLLGLKDEVGILKLGTTWPLPEKLIAKHLKHAKEVLFVEEIDPFLEQNVKVLAAELAADIGPIKFYGKKSNHIRSEFGAGVGELDVDTVMRGLTETMNVTYIPRDQDYAEKAEKLVGSYAPNRSMAFCAGCPHRASFWAIKRALKWDGRDGIVTGDIGCYSMAQLPTGFMVLKSMHCMGAGIGTATRFGNLKRYGLDKPVIAVSGDSTFYHACIPALINARWNKSNLLYVILDNKTTAMTGNQPHPGIGIDALGEPSPVTPIEDVCKGIGVEVRKCDPFDIDEATQNLYEMLQTEGVKVMIFSRECALTEAQKRKKKPRVYVDQDKCIGDECGCMRFCTRVLNCPGNIWDYTKGKAKIDEVVCNGCGLCAKLCPAGAIIVEEVV